MIRKLCFTLTALAVMALGLPYLGYGDASIYEEKLTLPTYQVGEPDPNPRFFEGRVYQGAQGRIYPYPISDVLTDNKVNQDYKAVYLENEYIKVCVLPEIGGRIFSALDKTNNYDFFYRQTVIKPTLIGMLGAWISGGVEWNFPHHHRANSFTPMDYTIDKNADGSQTLWLTEIERRHRMKFLLGLTITPGKSSLKSTVKIFNRTPMVNTFLFWANPAVQVDDTYQVFFPPETEYVAQHAKNQFSEWPISNSNYGGRDYKNVDISYWKNLTHSVSFFCWNYTADYFAGYNHGKEAGVAYIGNHYIAPGKKFFAFGCGPEGQMWDKRLTDSDGPYLELMAGGYSDNQPDYSWIQPYETKVFNQYWFPIRNMEGMKYANLNGALNLDFNDKNQALVRINTTEKQENSKILVKENNNIFFEKTVSIAPDAPFTADIPLPEKVQKENVSVTVLSKDGKELMTYKVVKRPGEAKPKPVTPPGNPKDFKTNEELFLAGQRIDQFYNAQLDSSNYYNEALSRDPDDIRVNTQLGILAIKGGQFDKAEGYLRKAVARLTKNYTRPKTCEAHYYLGVALRYQNKLDEAYEQFYKSIWDNAWRSAGYYQLAELDSLAGRYEKALSNLEESLVGNTRNTKAVNLVTAILRKTNRIDQAKSTLAMAKSIDPLDFWTMNEEFLLAHPEAAKTTDGKQETLAIRNEEETYLELATDYGSAGFYDDAIAILTQFASLHKTAYAMVHYYLGFYNEMLCKEDKAKEQYKIASTASPLYCFPYRLDSIDVLQHAMEINPEDAFAPYYLGNLFYDSDPTKATELWQKAIEMKNTSYVVYRNMGYAIARVGKDLNSAIAKYEKAIELNKNDSRLIYELDKLYESSGTDPQKRLALFENSQETVYKQMDTLAREVELLLRVGNYDQAIYYLTHYHFTTWEGSSNIHGLYVNACLLRGKKYQAQQEYNKALVDFFMATEYPENLEVGRPLSDPEAARTFYLTGQTYNNLGDKENAKVYFEKALALRGSHGDIPYYRALANLELGHDEEAGKIFDQLIQDGENRLKSRGETDFFAKFAERESFNSRQAQAHYLIGLGKLGKGDLETARQEFNKALEKDINHVWAAQFLSELK